MLLGRNLRPHSSFSIPHQCINLSLSVSVSLQFQHIAFSVSLCLCLMLYDCTEQVRVSPSDPAVLRPAVAGSFIAWPWAVAAPHNLPTLSLFLSLPLSLSPCVCVCVCVCVCPPACPPACPSRALSESLCPSYHLATGSNSPHTAEVFATFCECHFMLNGNCTLLVQVRQASG